MKKSTWLMRCVLMTGFLLVTNGLVLTGLMRSFSLVYPQRFIAAYIGMITMIIVCFRRIRSDAPYYIKCIGAYGMGLYITLTMAAVVCIFLPIPGWAAVLLALTPALYGFVHARKIKVKRYRVPLLKKNFRLLLISDVHLGSVGSEERLPLLIERINQEMPDLVCIAGDLIDNSFPAVRDPENAAKLFQKIESRCGIYACLGNHDAGKSAAEMQNFMKKAGIRVLQEEYIVLEDVLLLGRLDARPHGNYVNSSRGDTEKLLRANPRCDLPLIVIDHNPSVIRQYDGRTSLLLCGHTHNGQIFPGNLVIKAINTCGYGYYRKDGKSPHVVVSSGAGTWGPPMRIGTDCEVAVIELGP